VKLSEDLNKILEKSPPKNFFKLGPRFRHLQRHLERSRQFTSNMMDWLFLPR